MTTKPKADTVAIDLAATHRIVALEGLQEGTWTHLSALVPGMTDCIYVSPGNTHFSTVSASDLIMMDQDGCVLNGNRQPNSSAWCLHYPLHRARSDAACILHLHPLHATALFIRKGARLDPRLSQAAAVFHDDIAYFDTYDGVLEDPAEGERMAVALGDSSTLVLRNHGVMVCGNDVASAIERAYLLERACKFQLLADNGEDLQRIPEQLVRAIAEKERSGFGGYLAGMKRVLKVRGEDYSS